MLMFKLFFVLSFTKLSVGNGIQYIFSCQLIRKFYSDQKVSKYFLSYGYNENKFGCFWMMVTST